MPWVGSLQWLGIRHLYILPLSKADKKIDTKRKNEDHQSGLALAAKTEVSDAYAIGKCQLKSTTTQLESGQFWEIGKLKFSQLSECLFQ